MYWRINCAEHLLLLVEPDAEGGGTRRLGRQRSVTYSEGRVGGGSGSKKAAEGYVGDVHILRWSCAPSGHLLAGISAHGVYLWQTRPFMLLSKLEYEPNEALGQMVDVIWQTSDSDDDDDGDSDSDDENDNANNRRDYGTLFVLLSSGYIYEIAVYRRTAAVLEYRFATQHYWARGAGEENGLRRAGLAQRRTYRLALTGGSGPAVCAAAAGATQGALVATRTHVVRLGWSGVVEASTSVRAIHGSPLALVQQIVALGAAGDAYLFDDGTVHVVRAGAARHVETDGRRVTCMAYGARCGVLALGAASGDVLLVAVPDDVDGDGDGDALQTVAEAAEGGERAGDAVTALAWTADGAAVACAHASGHVVVRSALGYVLNTSRVRQTAGAPAVAVALCWGAGDTRLFVLGGGTATALAFARAAVATGVGEGTAAHMCVFTDDKVLVHDGAFAEGTGGGSADAAAAQQWQAASVPAEYVAGAWPLRHVAVSGDGRHVAVAGRRGVAVGGVRSGKWRLLRTREQERQIRVGGGLLWLGSHVVAACGAHVVVFTDALRGALDGDAAVRVHVGARVLAMSAHDALVLVACGDGRVRQVAVFAQGSGVRVDVRGVVDVGDGGARLQLRRLRSVQWVPSAQFARAPALLVHEGTRLRVVSRSGAWTVSERAELTVTSGVHFGNMHSTVWWFDGRLLHAALVSLEDFMDGGALRSDGGGARRLAVRPSFYPVAIAAALGMAVGVDQDWTLDDAACSPALAQLPVRAKLYLPSVLARMLADSSSGSHDALLYAACFEHLAFFAHAMEILLHEAVEDAQPAVLRRAVAMLGNFGAFPEIIVHCARKTEAASWPALFACLGGPESFFRRCVHAGRLGTATQCLIILHTLAPHAAERGVLMLLARAVDRRAQTLCVEILRFVRMAAAEDATMAGLLDKVQCVEG